MDRFRALQAFRAVAHQDGFAAAARVLNTSPPSVSRLVADLEADLGVRLFNRSTRSVTLTEEGAYLLDRGAGLLDELEALAEEVRQRRSEPRGHLRISSVTAFGQERVARAIPAFLEAHPGVTVELELLNRKVDLIQERVDIAIRVGASGQLEPSSLKSRKIFDQKLFFVATPDYVRKNGAPSRLEDITTHRVVKHISGDWGRITRLCHGAQIIDHRLPETYVVNSPNAALSATLSGHVIGLIGDFMSRDLLKSGQLVRVLPEYETPSQPIFALFVHQSHMPAKIRAFLDFLTDELAHQASASDTRRKDL